MHKLKETKAGDLSERSQALGPPEEVGLSALAGLAILTMSYQHSNFGHLDRTGSRRGRVMVCQNAGVLFSRHHPLTKCESGSIIVLSFLGFLSL